MRRKTARRLSRVLALLLVVGAVGSGVARADTQSDLDTAEARAEQLTTAITQATQTRDTLVAQLGQLLADADQGRRDLEKARARVADLMQQIEDITNGIGARQAAIDRRSATIYMNGPASGLEAILGTRSLADFQDAMAFFGAAAATDRNLVTGLAATRTDLDATRSELSAAQADLDATSNQLDAQGASLQAKLLEQQAVVEQLAADRAEAAKLVRDLQEQKQRELLAQILADSRDPWWPYPKPAPGPLGDESVPDMIVRYFTPLGQDNVDLALCVGYRESNYLPWAENVDSGAAGVFQFMPEFWPALAAAAGWPGASPFEAEPNVSTAAWTVAHWGWWPWKSDSGVCPMPL